MGKRKSKSSKQPLLESEDEQTSLYELDQGDGESPVSPETAEDRYPFLAPETQSQYCCRVHGPGIETATANHPTHVLVELRDVLTGQPCTQSQTVSAELHSELAKEDKHRTLFKRRHQNHVSVDQKTTATYRVSFTAANRGKHQLHIKIGGREIEGSPCNITLFPDPNQLHKPVGEIPNRSGAWDVTVNSRGEIIASDFPRNEVITLNKEGEVISSIDCRGPTGVAVDENDNIYVSCMGEVKKFSRDGRPLSSVGRTGQREGEFIRPEGLRCRDGLLYVCDTLNHRIQVFQTDTLSYVRTIGSHGSGNIEFDHPWAIDFDLAGRAYVADQNNSRVQVIDVCRGGFLREIGRSGRRRLNRPTSVRVLGEFLYVSDDENCRVSVFCVATGEFVTSFGCHIDPSGKIYKGPFRVCSADRQDKRLIYVFDLTSARIF